MYEDFCGITTASVEERWHQCGGARFARTGKELQNSSQAGAGKRLGIVTESLRKLFVTVSKQKGIRMWKDEEERSTAGGCQDGAAGK